MRGRASSHDQPGSPPWERIKNVFPGYGVAAAPVGNREHQIPGCVDGGDDERVCGARNRRHHVPAHNSLKPQHDARRTRRAAVVDRIPAVPARSTGAHLRDPRPHLFRWRVNRDRVGRREDGSGINASTGSGPRRSTRLGKQVASATFQKSAFTVPASTERREQPDRDSPAQRSQPFVRRC